MSCTHGNEIPLRACRVQFTLFALVGQYFFEIESLSRRTLEPDLAGNPVMDYEISVFPCLKLIP